MPEIADSLVVDTGSLEDAIGQMWLFVVPRAGITLDADLKHRIKSVLKAELSPRHVPDRDSRYRRRPPHPQRQEAGGAGQAHCSGARLAEVVNPGTLQNPEALFTLLGACGCETARLSTRNSRGASSSKAELFRRRRAGCFLDEPFTRARCCRRRLDPAQAARLEHPAQLRRQDQILLELRAIDIISSRRPDPRSRRMTSSFGVPERSAISCTNGPTCAMSCSAMARGASTSASERPTKLAETRRWRRALRSAVEFWMRRQSSSACKRSSSASQSGSSPSRIPSSGRVVSETRGSVSNTTVSW